MVSIRSSTERASRSQEGHGTVGRSRCGTEIDGGGRHPSRQCVEGFCLKNLDFYLLGRGDWLKDFWARKVIYVSEITLRQEFQGGIRLQSGKVSLPNSRQTKALSVEMLEGQPVEEPLGEVSAVGPPFPHTPPGSCSGFPRSSCGWHLFSVPVSLHVGPPQRGLLRLNTHAVRHHYVSCVLLYNNHLKM